MAELAGRLDADVRASTDVLIRLHGLDGRAGDEVLRRLAHHYALRQPLTKARRAVGRAGYRRADRLKADIAPAA